MELPGLGILKNDNRWSKLVVADKTKKNHKKTNDVWHDDMAKVTGKQ